MILGSILTNIEVAYNLTTSEIEKLEKCHEMALRKLINLPSKTPKVMLYFITGSTPIRFTVNPNGPELLESLKLRGERQMAPSSELTNYNAKTDVT